jgi:hypothetical protein
MIEHVWSVLCSQAVIDRDTNNISLFNALEQVTIPASPPPGGALVMQYEVTTFWARVGEPVEGKMRLRVLGPEGQALLATEAGLDLVTAERTRNRLLFQQLPIVGEGIYRFVLDLFDDAEAEWVQVARLPLQVKFADVDGQSGRFGVMVVAGEEQDT